MHGINWFIVHLVCGVWLMISPYVLGFGDIGLAYWNTVALGILFALSSITGLYYGRGDLSPR